MRLKDFVAVVVLLPALNGYAALTSWNAASDSLNDPTVNPKPATGWTYGFIPPALSLDARSLMKFDRHTAQGPYTNTFSQVVYNDLWNRPSAGRPSVRNNRVNGALTDYPGCIFNPGYLEVHASPIVGEFSGVTWEVPVPAKYHIQWRIGGQCSSGTSIGYYFYKNDERQSAGLIFNQSETGPVNLDTVYNAGDKLFWGIDNGNGNSTNDLVMVSAQIDILSSLSGLSMTQGSTVVGGSATMTVILTAAQPFPTTVSLVSSDPSRVSIPSSVIIDAGTISKTFYAQGVAVGTSTITAQLPGGTVGSAFTTANVTVNAGNCSYTLSSSSATFDSNGGAGTVAIIGSPGGCAGSWASTSSAGWIHIISGDSGSGSGPTTLTYTIDPNSSSASRTASMTIAGRTFSITQSALTAPCVPDLNAACMLNNRFRVTVRYRAGFDNGATDSVAKVKSVTGFAAPNFETAFFYFNSESNIEVIVKILDQGNRNSQGLATIDVLTGSATPLRAEVTIVDTLRNGTKTYTSNFGAQDGKTEFGAFVK
jgi:hypothetical protein